MGVFDSVFFTCPGCGSQIEAQSKALPFPYMTRFTPEDVPLPIAVDLLYGEDDRNLLLVDCPKCERDWRIVSDPPLPERVTLRLESVGGAE